MAGREITAKGAAGTGFWRGVAVGSLVSLALAVLLAYVFPPRGYAPPRLAPEAVRPPGAMVNPEAVEPAPVRPRLQSGLLVEAPAPLLTARPAPDMPPSVAELAPSPAPDVFDGGPAGSPSLFPQAPKPEAAPQLR